jgi:hypothetical protein
MADINQYKIIKELYTGEQLTVYQVEDSKDGKTGILRLIHQLPLRNAWETMYREYEAEITHYKHLPAVKTHDVWALKPFVVLEADEGDFLEKEQILTGKQIDQFVDAVAHLHKHKLYHGKITRFNIWIKENGDITLYGAGERTVFQPDRKVTFQDDLKQVISILKNHSSIPESYFEERSFKSIEELQDWVLRKLAIPKPGLVDLGESSKTVFGVPKNEVHKVEEPKLIASEPTIAHPIEKRKSGSLIIGVVVAAMILGFIFSISSLKGGSERASNTSKERKQETVDVKNKQQANAPEVKKEEVDLGQFAPLFSGWDLIKYTSIKLAGHDYTLVAAAQKQDDSSGIVKVSVLSKAKNGKWTKVGESDEYKGNSSETKSYIDSFLTITSENGQMGLLVFGLPSGLDISEVIAITVQANGTVKQIWSEYGKIEQNKNVINVTGIEKVELYFKNNKFTFEKTK